MSEFSYFSVLLSIILGLAITHLLQGWRGWLIAHRRQANYWPTHLWSLLLLLICTQFWWSLFNLAERRGWTFAEFAVLLLQTILIYLTTALVYPDFVVGTPVDLRAHYFEQRRHFYALLAVTVVVGAGQDLVLFHALPKGAKLWSLLYFLAVSLLGFRIANERFHKLTLGFSTGLFVLSILFLFSHLKRGGFH